MRQTMVMAVAAGLLVAACSNGESASPTTTTAVPTTTAPATTTAPTSTTTATTPEVQALLDTLAAGIDTPTCEYLGDTIAQQSACLLPFPSDFFRADGRVALPNVLRNVDGVAIDMAEWNRNDGFSPNTPLLAYVPGVDPAASNLPMWTDIGASLAADSPVVIVDATTGDRIPLWAELDAHATTDADRLLTIRPAISLPEGHEFVVGLRDMVDATGDPVHTPAYFAIFRDAIPTGADFVEARRPAMEHVFDVLDTAGVERAGLQLAWSFTTATSENIAGRMLHIRDDALAQLGDKAPAYNITAVTPNTDTDIALQVSGTFTVPNYLTGDGGPGQRFHYDTTSDPDAMPTQNGTLQAPFVCNISVATMNGTAPAHLVEYGHGLLGSNDEINAGNVRAMSNEHNVVHCATKWAGMSEDDVGNAAATLAEFSNFPTIADRLQQGVLNQILLGRLMTRPGGLGDDPAFHRPDGSSLVDTSTLNYDGNSQGGIMGLMLAAVSPDIQRAVLGVPGMNYSLLLPRSVDFDTYAAIMRPEYPSAADEAVIFGVVQMLWDRGEGAGYVQHVTADTYPGTPAKTVLLDVAYGDHQVTPLSALIEARALGATIHRPVAADGRWPEKDAGWGLDTTRYPSTGSAIVFWDSGMAPIPIENVAPRSGDDSHEDPRRDPDVRRQKASFLFDGTLVDVCSGAACQADHNP